VRGEATAGCDATFYLRQVFSPRGLDALPNRKAQTGRTCPVRPVWTKRVSA